MSRDATPAPRAVLLLSGGLDSVTSGAMARQQGFAVYALSVDYGQRHRIELESARRVAQHLGCVEHKLVTLDLRTIGGSALTDSIAVPKERDAEAMGQGIPVTYVPARNTILLALALGYAETVQAFDLFIGANILDYSGYPDCRPEFLDAFARVANLGTKAGVSGASPFRVHAPLIQLTKAEIIRVGVQLGVDYAMTTSCYDPTAEGLACACCDACLLRQKGFAEAGVPDPTPYTLTHSR